MTNILEPGLTREDKRVLAAMHASTHDHMRQTADIAEHVVLRERKTSAEDVARTLSGLEHLGYVEWRLVPSPTDETTWVDVWRRTRKGDEAIA